MPGAKIENTEEIHEFIGEKILRLKAGVLNPDIDFVFMKQVGDIPQ